MVDVAIQGLVQSVDKFCHAANLPPKFFRIACADVARSESTAPEYHPDGRNFDNWRNVQGGFRLDWKESARDTFTLQGDVYDEAAGKSVSATSYTAPYSQIIDANALLSGENILGRWTRVLGDGDDIQVQTLALRCAIDGPFSAGPHIMFLNVTVTK